MHSVAEADELIDRAVPTREMELVPLAESIGRVLAGEIAADRDGPPFDRICMDGIAISFADWQAGSRRYELVGSQFAGHPAGTLARQHTALEAATGAPMPHASDTIICVEDIERDGQWVNVRADLQPKLGQHIQKTGSDYKKGQVLLEAGRRVNAPLMHILASCGITQVPVWRRLAWALLATGDELVEVGQEPLPWQIRRSNTHAIRSEARAWGLESTNELLVADELAALTTAIAAQAAQVAVLVLTGGVSLGPLDLVPQALKDLGAREGFTSIQQKPGKPFWFGSLPNGCIVFGLPGNPVSSLFTFRRYVLPFLLQAEGRKKPVRKISIEGLPPPPQKGTLFVPVVVDPDTQRARAQAFTGSGDFLQLARTSGFAEIRSDADTSRPVPYHRWGMVGGN